MKIDSKLSNTLTAAAVTCFVLAHDVRAAATLVDVGTLNGNNSAYAFSVSVSGHATGRSFSSGSSSARCFRTQAMAPLNESSDPAANVHAFLNSYFYCCIGNSTGYDIEESASGVIEIAGELGLYNVPRAFWYYEALGGERTARLLSLAYQGTSSSAAALHTSYGGSTVVVGHCMVNGLAQACHWAVTESGDLLYNYGSAYFSGQNSWATDTDGERTIGYYGSHRFFPFIVDGSTGPMHHLPVGGGGDTAVPFGMHTSGTTSYIVGYTYQSSQTRPCVWTYTGNGNASQILLDNYGYQHGMARSINDAGQIVGSVWNTVGDEKACFWRISGSGGGLLNNQGAFGMDLVRAYKVAPSVLGSKVAGIGVTNGLSRGFILDHAD